MPEKERNSGGNMGEYNNEVNNEVNRNNLRLTQEEDTLLKRMSRLAGLGFVIIFLVISLCNSFYTLSEEEYAVVTTFGNPSVVDTAGFKFKLPFIQKVNKVPKSIMAMPIGYDAETNASIEKESLMITSDFNFVNTDFYLEYKVSDPIKAVINSESYYTIIKNLAQSYIRDTVGVHTVDDIMTSGKATIQSEIETKLKERILAEDIGFSIERVMIQDAEMPTEEVREAFKSVETAKQGMDTSINEANKYKSEQIPKAEAAADKIRQSAEAYKQDRINEATGQVARFERMYEEYVKYPLITKKRMFYETMEDVLPSLKVIIDSGSGTQTMLPLEPFNTTVLNQEASTEN